MVARLPTHANRTHIHRVSHDGLCNTNYIIISVKNTKISTIPTIATSTLMRFSPPRTGGEIELEGEKSNLH